MICGCAIRRKRWPACKPAQIARASELVFAENSISADHQASQFGERRSHSIAKEARIAAEDRIDRHADDWEVRRTAATDSIHQRRRAQHADVRRWSTIRAATGGSWTQRIQRKGRTDHGIPIQDADQRQLYVTVTTAPPKMAAMSPPMLAALFCQNGDQNSEAQTRTGGFGERLRQTASFAPFGFETGRSPSPCQQ